jgi:hypothetical protein
MSATAPRVQPHVIRGVERYRGRMVAYSLGNFVGYHTLAGGGVLSESAAATYSVADPKPNGEGEIDSRGYGTGDRGVLLGPLTVGMPLEVQTTGSMNN